MTKTNRRAGQSRVAAGSFSGTNQLLNSGAVRIRPRSVSSAVRDGVLNEQMPCQLRRISVATHGFGPY